LGVSDIPEKPIKPIGDEIINKSIISSIYKIEPLNETKLIEWEIYPSNAGEIVYNDTMAEVKWADYNETAYLYVIHSNNCTTVSDSLEIFVDRTSSNIENQFYHTALIFPNPSNGKINVDLSYLNGLSHEINIFDQLGRLLKSESIEDNVTTKEFYLSKGLYIVIVKSIGGIDYVGKVVIN
jgi:hypothetical protein